VEIRREAAAFRRVAITLSPVLRIEALAQLRDRLADALLVGSERKRGQSNFLI
jgi:hypothetical protein